MADSIKLTKTEMRPVEVPEGTVSLIRAQDFLPAYAETIRKFLKDNEGLGDKWLQEAYSKLAIYEDKNGFLAQSNAYAGVLSASLIPMVTHNQMRRACEKAGTSTPFGTVYLDLGFNINGSPQTNPAQAKYLLEQMKTKGINAKDPRGLGFNQLELKADQQAGLLFRIKEGANDDNVEHLDSSKFCSFGKNGLFRAYLGRDGNWYALVDYLAYSSDDGRVGRYDAEGVAVPKIKDLQKI
jgi:hypothetical protein